MDVRLTGWIQEQEFVLHRGYICGDEDICFLLAEIALRPFCCVIVLFDRSLMLYAPDLMKWLTTTDERVITVFILTFRMIVKSNLLCLAAVTQPLYYYF